MVGGAAKSRHLDGYAFDLVLDEMTATGKALLVQNAEHHGIVAIDEGDHIHLQLPRTPRRGSV